VRRWAWLLALGAFVMLGWAHAWLGFERRAIAARLHALERERMALAQRIERLRLERAALLRPERLRRWAQGRLGMGPPRPDQVVRDE